MSRTINIKGKLIIQNIEIAQEVLRELKLNIKIENNQFIFNEYDAWDKIDEREKALEIQNIENLYTKKFDIYLEQVAEDERLRIKEAKRVLQEEKAEIAIANAKKQGYKLIKEKRENNTIKLVLQKRIN